MSTLSSEALLQRRERLLVRSSQLRADMSWHVHSLRKPLGLADQARNSVDWLMRNPQWPIGALVAVAVLRPRLALHLAGTLWWGWGMFKRAKALLARF